jgi:hypothetical protein
VEPILEGEWMKFNNNDGWVSQDAKKAQSAQAFSHFTHHFTRGQLMIVDVQGIKDTPSSYLLTDPAVHSANKIVFAANTNCGAVGMTRFFETHRCNPVCLKLKLAKQSNQIKEDDLTETVIR